ncbi:MAG: nuclear transport factor 2 family protein [Burkholderiales bacterium]|nr:nuclear transport factor 2 family protein [Burkholderiales bacterium]
MSTSHNLDKLIDFFESISQENTVDLKQIYTDDVFFKDPFNEVNGIQNVITIFDHMFHQLDQPRFVVTTHVSQGDQAFLTWDFLFKMKRFNRNEQCIRGASHIRFAADGRVSYHRDYWDVAEELYEKLPLIGSVMRGLKKMANN